MNRKALSILTVISLLIIAKGEALSQNLIDLYKTGTIRLGADPDFAKGADWDVLFGDYNDTEFGRAVGKRKELAISDDGHIYVMNKGNRYNISEFDRNGRFIKSFGQKGRGSGDFWYRPSLDNVLGNDLIVTHGIQGRIDIFDTDGNYVKHVKLDYETSDILFIDENTLAFTGNVMYRKGKDYSWRRLVTFKDIRTGDLNS